MVNVTVTNLWCIAFGVFALWYWRGAGRFSLRDDYETLAFLGVPHPLWPMVELLVVMGLGVGLAAIILEPQTPKQAVVAGMAWTGLVPQAQKGGQG